MQRDFDYQDTTASVNQDILTTKTKAIELNNVTA
jgi:hypothetical protein